MSMSLPKMHPLVMDELLVLISGAFMESFTADEQAVIGTFLATLGSIISLNSVYILFLEGQNPENTDKNNQDKDEDNEYEILEKSIDKIKEEIEKLKKKEE